MVVGVDGYILPAQVASIAEIDPFADTHINDDGMLFFANHPADRLGVKPYRLAILKHRMAADRAAQFVQIDIHPAGADRTQNPAPVGVAAVDGTFD